jgi:phosphatidate cytidylyltransferase
MADRYANLLVFSTVSIFALLVVATFVSFALRKKKPENLTFQKVQAIVRSWWFIATPILVALLIGPLALLALFFLVTCFALYELTKFSELQNIKRSAVSILIATTVLQYLAIYLGTLTLFYSLIPVLVIWILPSLIILRAEVEKLPSLGSLILTGLLVSYYLSHVPALAIMNPSLWHSSDQASLAILLLIFATETNDIFQFLSGKAFGRIKLFPDISPSKTEAGFIGGILGTVLLFSFLGPALLEITVMQALILGFLISVTGIFGDLLFSAIKRYYGVKDFSDLIPGHGGLLDRVDSLILTAPVYFHLIFYFKAGIL